MTDSVTTIEPSASHAANKKRELAALASGRIVQSQPRATFDLLSQGWKCFGSSPGAADVRSRRRRPPLIKCLICLFVSYLKNSVSHQYHYNRKKTAQQVETRWRLLRQISTTIAFHNFPLQKKCVNVTRRVGVVMSEIIARTEILKPRFFYIFCSRLHIDTFIL